MGQWAIHIEGHGIHDNGREDDADAIARKALEELQQHHEVYSASFTVGSHRRLDEPKADAADADLTEAAE